MTTLSDSDYVFNLIYVGTKRQVRQIKLEEAPKRIQNVIREKFHTNRFYENNESYEIDYVSEGGAISISENTFLLGSNTDLHNDYYTV